MSGKGGEFERYVSKQLTYWLIGKYKPYKYWRMPASGGLATIHEECSSLSGDIRALAPEADFLTDIFSIECKTGYPNTSMWQHFKQIKNFGIKLFWEQCFCDSQKANKKPMLIYRKKGKQIILGIRREEYRKLKKLHELPSISIKFKNESLPEIIFFDFLKFLEATPPNFIRRLNE